VVDIRWSAAVGMHQVVVGKRLVVVVVVGIRLLDGLGMCMHEVVAAHNVADLVVEDIEEGLVSSNVQSTAPGARKVVQVVASEGNHPVQQVGHHIVLAEVANMFGRRHIVPGVVLSALAGVDTAVALAPATHGCHPERAPKTVSQTVVAGTQVGDQVEAWETTMELAVPGDRLLQGFSVHLVQTRR
jgi:urease beta subunit